MTSSGSLDYWRKLFRSTSSDIFQVVENAILVAASDQPEELLIRRGQIAERLFTCLLDRCRGCDQIQEPTDRDGNDGEDDEEEELSHKMEKESKVDSCCHGGAVAGVDLLCSSNYSYDEAEALTEEIEEEGQIVGEVLRIKSILDRHQDESDGVLFDSLRRLQLMALSVEILKATEIGRAVNRLRKHSSKPIRNLARMLIDGWKLLVDEWVNTAPAIPDNSPDSVNPSVLDEEEGLPFPPLDEGALFTTQTASIQLSEFFDEMDDDGNIRNEGEFDRKRESGGRPLESKKLVRNTQPLSDFIVPEPKEQRRQEPAVQQMKSKLPEVPNGRLKPHGVIKSKLFTTDSGPARAARLGFEQKGSSHLNSGVRKPIASEDKMKNSEDQSVRAKLEVAKRKLQERYQQAENAKRQRTIQVMELRDLPKQTNHNTNRFPTNVKHKSNIRNWHLGSANGRRGT